MAHFAPLKYVCVPNAITCPLSRLLHVCTHSPITKNTKIWQKPSFLDHKNYLVVFPISYPLSTSLHMSIHSCITSCFSYQYDTFCTHCKWRFFWGLHCDETLNVTILVFVTHEFHTWHDIFFLHCDETPNVIVLSFKHNMKFSHDS